VLKQKTHTENRPTVIGSAEVTCMRLWKVKPVKSENTHIDKITALDHEIFNHTMKTSSFVTLRDIIFPVLSRAKLAGFAENTHTHMYTHTGINTQHNTDTAVTLATWLHKSLHDIGLSQKNKQTIQSFLCISRARKCRKVDNVQQAILAGLPKVFRSARTNVSE